MQAALDKLWRACHAHPSKPGFVISLSRRSGVDIARAAADWASAAPAGWESPHLFEAASVTTRRSGLMVYSPSHDLCVLGGHIL
jgi:hypothetical protein